MSFRFLTTKSNYYYIIKSILLYKQLIIYMYIYCVHIYVLTNIIKGGIISV